MVELKGILDATNKGLMAGNGCIGAVLFGENELSLSLDRIDLWDRRMPKEFADENFNYDYLVRTFEDDYQEAYRLFDGCYLHPFPSKITAGILKTNIKVSDKDQGFIDESQGQIAYRAQNNHISAYVDAHHDVIVIHAESPFTYRVEMPPYFQKSVADGGLGYPPCDIIYDGRFEIIRQKTYDDHSFSVIILPDDYTLYLTIIDDDHLQEAKLLLQNYQQNHERNHQRHRQAYADYYATADIKTPDEKINRLFRLGRYYFFANSRRKYPVTLQGVWTDNNEKLPPWKGDLHNDLNIQLSYEPYLKLGNFAEGKVLLDYLHAHREQFAKNARAFLGGEGLFVPGVMTIDGLPLGGWPQYSLNPCCQIWLIQAFDAYYQYTKDDDYLAEVIYPFYAGVEQGIRSILNETSDGFYELGFHASPEYYENEPASLFKDQTNFEITLLRFLYQKLIEYAEHFGKDPSPYQNILNHLRPYERNEKGEMKISKSQEYDMSHRHFSHLLGYKNVPVIDPYINKDALRKDMAVLDRHGTDEWVGFSFTEYASFNTLINRGEQAYRALSIFADYFVHDNGFHMNNDFKTYQHSKMTCYVFTLEANFNFVTALSDMMLKNYQNKVTIFPAIPASFIEKGVNFKSLRLRGGHRVSAKISNGNLNFFIEMKSPDTLLLENNFGDNPTLLVDGDEIKFATKKGDFVQVKATSYISYSSSSSPRKTSQI